MEKDLKEVEVMKIEKKVYRLRHRDGLEWTNVADRIRTEFEKNLSSEQVEEIYDKHVARAKTINNSNREKRRGAAKVGEAWVKEIKGIIKEIRSISLAHLKIANEKLLTYAEMEDDKKYFDYLPTMVSVTRSLLDQATFLSRRLEKVEIVQNKLVLNETQILQIVNQAYAQKARETGYIIHPGTGKLVPAKNKDL